MLKTIINLSLLASMVRYATPLTLASLGGMFSERGGVINIALEGIMVAGAFTAAAVTVSGTRFESTGSTPQLPREQTLPEWHIPLIDHIPVLKQLISGHTPISYLAFALVPISYYVIFRTRFGLRLRAVGENPEAADTAGVSVYGVRYAGVLLSGLLAGIGGAYL